MLKPDDAVGSRKGFGRCRVVDGRFGGEHFVDTFAGHRCTRQHNAHHGQHQEAHDDHHGIGDEGGHFADAQRTGVDAVGSRPHDQHRNTVHQQHHTRQHEAHAPVGKQHVTGQVAVGAFKALLLDLFAAKGADDRQTGQNFTRDQVDVVDQNLHFLELGHGDLHQHADEREQQRHGQHNDPLHARAGADDHENAAQR